MNRHAFLGSFICATLSLLSASAFADATKSYTAKDIKLVRLTSASGDVTVTANTDTVDLRPQVISADGVVAIESITKDIAISVPKGVQVRVTTGSGDVRFSGTFRKIHSNTGSGDTYLNGDVADARLDTGSGDMTIKGRSPMKLNATAPTGEVHFTAKLPKKAVVKIDSANGEINFNPEGGYRLKTRAGNGDLFGARSGKSTVRGGGAKVSLTTANGTIRVGKK